MVERLRALSTFGIDRRERSSGTTSAEEDPERKVEPRDPVVFNQTMLSDNEQTSMTLIDEFVTLEEGKR
jgi:hypothetical protein